MDQHNQTADSELQKVQAILEQQIRPALQMHGGDVQVTDLTDNVVTINYKGACGGCPGAATATLGMITEILRQKYNKEVSVKIG